MSSMKHFTLLAILAGLGVTTACNGVAGKSGTKTDHGQVASSSAGLGKSVPRPNDIEAAPLVLKYSPNVRGPAAHDSEVATAGERAPSNLIVRGTVRRLQRPFIQSGSIAGDRYLAEFVLDASASIGAWQGNVIDFRYDEFELIWFEPFELGDRLCFAFSADGTFIDALPEYLYDAGVRSLHLAPVSMDAADTVIVIPPE